MNTIDVARTFDYDSFDNGIGIYTYWFVFKEIDEILSIAAHSFEAFYVNYCND